MACNSATVCALCLWSARVADNITWKVHAHKSGRKKINSFENKNRNIVIFEFMLWDLHTAATHIERTWKEKCNLSLLIARYSTRHVDLCKRPPQANIYYYTHILCKYISCFAPLLLWHIPSENFLVSCCAKIFVFIITCKYVFVGCVCGVCEWTLFELCLSKALPNAIERLLTWKHVNIIQLLRESQAGASLKIETPQSVRTFSSQKFAYRDRKTGCQYIKIIICKCLARGIFIFEFSQRTKWYLHSPLKGLPGH